MPGGTETLLFCKIQFTSPGLQLLETWKDIQFWWHRWSRRWAGSIETLAVMIKWSNEWYWMMPLSFWVLIFRYFSFCSYISQYDLEKRSLLKIVFCSRSQGIWMPRNSRNSRNVSNPDPGPDPDPDQDWLRTDPDPDPKNWSCQTFHSHRRFIVMWTISL